VFSREEKDKLKSVNEFASPVVLPMSSGLQSTHSSMSFAPFRFSVLFCMIALALATLCHAALAQQFIGYTGKPWANDFGVLRGQCQVQDIQASALKGEFTGAMAQVEPGDLFTAIFPASDLVDAFTIDSHCFGHTLELVPSGQAVRWLNPASGIGVYLSPGQKSDSCRSFLGVTVFNGEKRKFRGEACSPSKGMWRVLN
jgi:hypothetical protein